MWHDELLALDTSAFDQAKEAFTTKLASIRQSLGEAEELLAHHTKDRETLAAELEESMLGDAAAQAKATRAMAANTAAIANAELQIEVKKKTMNRERQSPELAALAQNLWDAAIERRDALMALIPDAMDDLNSMKQAYLEMVAQVGDVGRTIHRLDNIANRAAAPFMAEQQFQPFFEIPDIAIDPAATLRAYDPSRRLAPGGVNPAALVATAINADSALGVLTKED